MNSGNRAVMIHVDNSQKILQIQDVTKLSKEEFYRTFDELLLKIKLHERISLRQTKKEGMRHES